MRASGRTSRDLRPVAIEIGVNRHAEGSCLIKVGDTHVICTASIEDRVPPFMIGRGEGWVTAEYGMLPRATHQRVQRERAGTKPAGRVYEIQRLIGRTLRAVVDKKTFGERTIHVDCDVIQADGGTRCASITGGFVALSLAFESLSRSGRMVGYPLSDMVAAVSIGIVAGEAVLDLDYAEDSAAEVDMNVVRTATGKYVELQGTAEDRPFSRSQLTELLDLADAGIDELIATQRETLGDRLARVLRPR
ncbi:MAG: ribonuclease PH [Acidobacteriota bacterium]